MKILTTQNLNSLERNNTPTNNIAIPNEIRYDYEQSFNRVMLERSYAQPAVTFKRGPIEPNEVKRAVEIIKKALGKLSDKAMPEQKMMDKLYRNKTFNKVLGVVDYETVVGASIAAVACALRGGTIMAMSNENNRGNNTYAVSHAFASGLVGLVTVFALTTPFKAGADHVLQKMFKDLKLSTLKRLYPHLDEKSIVDKAGKRIPEFIEKTVMGKDGKEKKVKEILWKGQDGLPFCKDIRNCQMMPKPKNLADVSVETMEKILKIENVDWSSQAGKSFNEVVAKDGKKLYDVISFENLSWKIANKEVSAKNGKLVESKFDVLIRDLDRSVFEDLIAKADDASPLKKLDLGTVYKDGKVQDFRQWKELGTGRQWMLDLDSVQVSSPLETYDQVLRSDGRLRFDEKEGIHKLRTRQPNALKDENGVEGLGTEITNRMIKADKENEGLLKSLTWLPDLAFRIPVALFTVNLIPWMLKTVFHVEKKKPAVANNEVKPVEVNKEVKASEVSFKGAPTQKGEEDNQNVSFKGVPSANKSGFFSKLVDKIGEAMAKLYGRPLIESEWLAKVSAKLSDVPGGLTQAMTAGGALLTSSAYVYGTLSNKNLETDKRRTLAINQTLCWIVPTIGAYLVDSAIKDRVKKAEYRFGNLQRGDAALANVRGEVSKADEILAGLGKKVKGVRVLASLAVFTVIYRYLTPVLVTPFANRIGDKLNAKRAEKRQLESQKEAKAIA